METKTEDLEELRAWERQPGEGDASWSAFCVYRDMHPADRTLRGAARYLLSQGRRGNENTLKVFARDYAWRARVVAYDRWRDQQKTRAEVEEVNEMRRRHVQIAMNLQGAAALALNKIIEAEKSGKELTLKPSDVANLADLGMRIERLTRGEPTAIEEAREVSDAEPSGPVAQQSYSRLSRDELLQMRALLDKARSGDK